MSLAALVTETLPLAQITLTQGNEKAAAEPLIDRLVNRLGARAVRRLFPRASHIPELAQSLKSAFAGPSFWLEQPEKPKRPPLLFARPEPLTVLAEIPEGPPARFTWRHVTRRVVKAEGPERIAPEWWRGLRRERCRSHAARPRDYYRVEDEDGHRYWVFREGLYQEAAGGTPIWYLHGVFG
jgi:protein ImuB